MGIVVKGRKGIYNEQQVADLPTGAVFEGDLIFNLDNPKATASGLFLKSSIGVVILRARRSSGISSGTFYTPGDGWPNPNDWSFSGRIVNIEVEVLG